MKEGERAHDICAGECERILYGPVHMALCREMDDSVYIIFCENLRYMSMITDISLHEDIVRTILDVLKVLQVARIGQRIEVYDPVIRILIHEKSYDMAAYEAGTACNQYVSLKL